MHAKKRKEAFHEPHEFRVRAPIESGGGPPHSKTLARWPQSRALPPGFGVRRPCGALDCPDRFMVPMHGIKVVGAFHEPDPLIPSYSPTGGDRKSTRLNSSHGYISYAV